ncbi:hypothetical protein ACVXG7_11970 [Enterobacter hormaechei]
MKDWKKGERDLIPGVTAPHIIPVERDYPATYERFTSIGPLMEKIGNGGKGIAWNTQSEMDLLRKLNYTKADGPAKGQPMLNTAIDAAEMILTLAPETNGHVAVKAWAALSEPVVTIRTWRRIRGRENPLPRYSGPAAQDYLQPDLV